MQVDKEKKKVLGQHLDFLVGQTEKFSSMITQDLHKGDAPPGPCLPSLDVTSLCLSIKDLDRDHVLDRKRDVSQC